MKRLIAFLMALQALLLPTTYAVAALADEVYYPEPESAGAAVWPFIAGGGALLVIAAALFFIIIKTKRKKKN